MKSTIKFLAVKLATAIALSSLAFSVHAQFKMEGGGKISKSSGVTAGKIASDGKTIISATGETLGKVSGDGKAISNKNGVTVLKISGSIISNGNGATVGSMSDVTKAINGAKPDAVHAALWWFVVKGNK